MSTRKRDWVARARTNRDMTYWYDTWLIHLSHDLWSYFVRDKCISFQWNDQWIQWAFIWDMSARTRTKRREGMEREVEVSESEREGGDRKEHYQWESKRNREREGVREIERAREQIKRKEKERAKGEKERACVRGHHRKGREEKEWACTRLPRLSSLSMRAHIHTSSLIYSDFDIVSRILCCSVLQCVAVCCSVLQCVAVCYSVLQCVLQFVAVFLLE